MCENWPEYEKNHKAKAPKIVVLLPIPPRKSDKNTSVGHYDFFACILETKS